jgi:hypothetical protein
MPWLLDKPNHPLGQIAGIDVLNRITRRVRGEHFTSLVDTDWPIRPAVRVITWSDNEAGPDDNRVLAKGFLGCLLTKSLPPTVSRASIILSRRVF